MYVDVNNASSVHSSAPPASTTAERAGLRHAFGKFATGVTIVTTRTADGPLGITANSFSSVSLDPAIVLWSIARESRRFEPFSGSRFQAIHVLADDQTELCRRFFRSGTDFSSLDVGIDRNGVPLLPGVLARFDCEIVNRVECGDHLVLMGQVRSFVAADGEPLVFSSGHYGRVEAISP